MPDHIEFSDAPGPSWDRETSELRIHSMKFGAPLHIITFSSRDRFGTDFELFDILDFFGLRSNHFIGGSIWQSFTIARLTELGFLGLVNITERRSNSGETRMYFEYEQEDRAFTLSYDLYSIKYIEAHNVREDKALIIALPIKNNGHVDFKCLKSTGATLTLYNGINTRMTSERIIKMQGDVNPAAPRPVIQAADGEPEIGLQLAEAPAIGRYFTLFEKTEEEDLWNTYEIVRIN